MSPNPPSIGLQNHELTRIGFVFFRAFRGYLKDSFFLIAVG